MTKKRVVDSDILSEWIEEWTLKGTTADKQAWEKFVQRFLPSSSKTTTTTAQSCHVEWRETVEKPAKTEVETLVVWNGNGMRARWTGESEFKQLLQMANPDVLCFLEGKTDINRLLQLKDFETSMRIAGYKDLYCYWSKKDSETNSYGNEGIVLL